jgi:hypothetical protein
MSVLLIGLTETDTGIDQIRVGMNTTTLVVFALVGTGRRRREKAVRLLVRGGVRRQQLCDGRRDENAGCGSRERDARRRQLLILWMLL